jgi:hypothetical protein
MSIQGSAAVGFGSRHAIVDQDKAVVRFASIQLFALIYLQKFALFPSFQLSVPMLIMFAGIGWMVVTKKLDIAAQRLASYMSEAAFCPSH